MINSVDSDQILHSAASLLGLNCLLLPVSPSWVNGIAQDKVLFSSPVRKYRKSYCTTPGFCIGVGVNKNVKVLRQSF